jgi:hypothetical protein
VEPPELGYFITRSVQRLPFQVQDTNRWTGLSGGEAEELGLLWTGPARSPLALASCRVMPTVAETSPTRGPVMLMSAARACGMPADEARGAWTGLAARRQHVLDMHEALARAAHGLGPAPPVQQVKVYPAASSNGI